MLVTTGVNIALALLGMVIATIILGSCLEENKKADTPAARHFTALVFCLVGTLLLDAIGWTCHGLAKWSMLRTVTRTLVDIGGYRMLILLVQYLKHQLPRYRKFMTILCYTVSVLSGIAMVASVLNIHYGFYFTVNEVCGYVHGPYAWVSRAYPLVGLVACIVTVCAYPEMKFKNRILFLLCSVFPLAGMLIDYAYPAWSMTYIGALIGIITLYTNSYIQKRRIISEQKTALMISQINPHFMYNTLTTIASMCDLDPKEAKALTIDFSSYLRQNLNTLSTNQLISFDQEMRHVECYLKIEKARFREKLNVIYNLDYKAFYLPALTVQPLVENAVRCGLSKRPEGGTVRIVSYDTGKSHVIEIIDDGVGFDPDHLPNDGRTHVGIENVRNRLKDMCNGTLTIKSKVGVGTRVTVEIPVKRKRRGGKA